MTTFEVTLPDELTFEVDRISDRMGLSRQDLVATAVRTFLDNRNRWHREIELALSDADQDEDYDSDLVLEWMESWESADEKPHLAHRPKQ